MRRFFLPTLAMAGLISAPVRAQDTPQGPAQAPTQDSAAVARAINDLEVQWGASLAAGNWDAVGTFLAPGYISTDDAGKRMDRSATLADLRRMGEKYSTPTMGPYTVLVSGNSAVHFGEATYTVTSKKGQVKRVHTVWTDTWIRQPSGLWLCVAGQSVTHPAK